MLPFPALPRLSAAALAGLLAGCSTVPITSLPALSRINFATTDFAKIRVAVVLPKALAPRPGGVHLKATTKLTGTPDHTEDLVLTETQEAADLAGLPATTPTSATFAFRLTEGDAARLTTLRAEMMQRKAQGQHGSVGIGIEAKEFCTREAPPAKGLLVSTFLSTTETRGYVPVSSNLDVASEPNLAEGIAGLEPCPASAH